MNPFLLLIQNRIIQSTFISFLIACTLKVVLNYYKSKKVRLKLFFKSGHMPSSHTATVIALTFGLYHETGISNIFIVALVFSIIVVYDAVGVRRAAGKQAAIINKIFEEFQMFKKIKPERLYEFIGHTPKEVIAGAIIGFVVSYLVF
ncbi:divergent PAP2 family protein [Candidatus Woesearchaeota archaeon]|nr:divergent PAP2 family protein [Candidatus Woesearchaeota archaeon]